MQFSKSMICVECDESYEPEEKLFRCKKCGGSLDILYDYTEIKRAIKKDFHREKPRHWKYWMFYPVDPWKKITLQEGGTPLIQSSRKKEVYFKLEGTNPTGSFKDRGTTVEATKAVELGIRKVCVASTGNMGASVAAYCGRGGIACKIFLPANTSPDKVKQIRVYGGKIVRVKGSYTDALKQCETYAKKTGTYLMGDYPMRGEGEKSVGFEIADQMGWEVPDYVICPMGNGTLIYAVWDAFNELKTIGLVKKLPKMIGVQAEGCNPIVKAFVEGGDIVPIDNPKTIASAVECGDPLDGEKALKALRESGGDALTVSDKDMLEGVKALARSEGLFVETASAATVAGLSKLDVSGRIVCVLTGHGLKDSHLKL